MADRKSRMKNKKKSNKSSSQKKINKTRQKERNSNSRSDPGTNSRSDQRTSERSSSRISACYQMFISRITRPFGRGPMVDQNERTTTAGKKEGNFNDGPHCEPSVPGSNRGIIKQNRRGEIATTHQRELFDAVQDLLKPKKPTPYSDVPQVNISFCIKFHSKITSVLIEMYNTIPDLHDTGSEKKDWGFQSEKLRQLLTRGSFAGFSRDKAFVASSTNKNREEKARRRRRSKLVLFLAKATSILPKPRSLCRVLQTRKENAQLSRNDSVMQTPLQPPLPEVTEITMQKTSTTIRTPTRIPKHVLPFCSVKRLVIKGKLDSMMQPSLTKAIKDSVQKKVLRTETLPMPPKRTVPITKPCEGVIETTYMHKEQLVRSTDFVRILFHLDCEKHTLSVDKNCFLSLLEVMQKEFMIVTKGTASDALSLQSLSADISSRNAHRIKITVELPGAKPLEVSSVPVSLIQSLLQRRSKDSMVPITNSCRDTKTRKFTKAGRDIAVGIESFSSRCVATVRELEEWQRPIVLPDEAIIVVSEKFLEMNVDKEFLPFYKELEAPGNFATFLRQSEHRLIPEEAVTAVALRFLETDDCIQETIMYQEVNNTEKANVEAIINSDNTCGVTRDIDREANKSVGREEEDEIYDNEIEIKGDKKVPNELIREDFDDDSPTKYKLFGDGGEMRKTTIKNQRINYYNRERLPTIPEEPEDQLNLSQCEPAANAVEVYESEGACVNYSDHDKISSTYEQREHTAVRGEKSKEFQQFNTSVPSHLAHIEIPFKDITDVVFEKDEEGEPLILSSGGFGDIYLARLSDTNETIVVKTIEAEEIDCEDVLRETRIQIYLTPGQYVPAIKGVIAAKDQPEIMILQQFCAGGRTLYDIIEACLAETLTLLDSHWLQLAYKLVLSYENMHKKGVLHNDIKSDNILVDLKPYDARPFPIDFGMATFRKGGRLVLPTGISDCGLEEDHLAPEVRHSQPSSPKSDIYSLGKVFQEMAYFCNELSPLSQEMCNDNPADRPTLEELADEIEDIMVEKDL